MHANQEMFTAEMQELFGILQSNNIFNHSNSLKKKNHVIILTDAERIGKNSTTIQRKICMHYE